MLSANKGKFHSFLSNLSAFYFFFFTALARHSNTKVNLSGWDWSSWPWFLNSGGKHCFPPLSIMSTLGFPDTFTFYQAEEAPFPACWEFLSWMDVGILSNAFPEPIMFFLLIWYITLIDFQMWNQSCILE